MSNSESDNGIKGRALNYELWTLSIFYFLILAKSVYNLYKSLITPLYWGASKQRAFQLLIFLFCSGKIYSARIFWIYFLTFNTISLKALDCFDAFPDTLLCILGSTITLIWFEIYLNSESIEEEFNNKLYFIIILSIYLIINLVSLIFHILIIFNFTGLWNKVQDPFICNTILDSSTNLFVAIGMAFTGCKLSIKAKIIFFGRLGETICRRIRVTSYIFTFMFMGKSAYLWITFFYFRSPGKVNLYVEYLLFSFVVIFFYFFCLEIFPIALILCLVGNVSEYSEDVIPSALESFVTPEYVRKEKTQEFFVKLLRGFNSVSTVNSALFKSRTHHPTIQGHEEIIKPCRRVTK